MLKVSLKPWVMATSAISNPFDRAGPPISLENEVERNEKPRGLLMLFFCGDDLALMK